MAHTPGKCVELERDGRGLDQSVGLVLLQLVAQTQLLKAKDAPLRNALRHHCTNVSAGISNEMFERDVCGQFVE